MTSAEQNPNEISSVVCCLGDSSQTFSVVLSDGSGGRHLGKLPHNPQTASGSWS